ncbi:MAG TPA: glycoside hydrolase family 76 protein, partial [Afifellaceae bacterium]|nr:glycoside hydrolase family 76 protein [Afifellaceae bacterium]
FEKMLSDNGQLLTLLVQAHGRTGSPVFRQRIEETAGWLLREMRLDHGAFATSLDADTEGEEGATYVWTPDEIREALGDGAPRFAEVYEVTGGGNFEGKNILNRLAPASRDWLGDDEEARLAEMRAKLLEIRNRRPQPGRDDKALADWNGAAITGLAQAGLALSRPDWLEVAAGAFRFVSETMTREGGRLGHSWMEGQLVFPGFATDYAQMIRAALTLYGATAEEAYLDQARRWYQGLEADYWDEAAGRYWLTAASGEALVARPSASSDDPMPSANGVMVQTCVQLFNLTAEERYRTRAEAILNGHASEMAADIVGGAGLLAGLDSVLRGRLALLTGGGDLEPLRRLVRHEADPALLVMESANGKGEPPRPEMQVMAGDETALLLCDAAACRAPVSDTGSAEALLAETRAGLAA